MTRENSIFQFRQENSAFARHNNTAPVFSAILRPYRSLGKPGFLVLMMLVFAACLVSGLFFLVAGAWPVMIMMGVDAAAIWLAFVLNYRSGRRYEEIAVWPDQMILRKVAPSGKSLEMIFNPFWVKFLVERHEEFGITAMKLRQAGKETELGSFLNPDDRTSFATAFNTALAKIR